MGNGVGIVLNFKDGVLGFFYLEIDDGVDAHGDIIFGDDFLLGNVNGSDAEVDFDHALDDGDDPVEAGLFGFGVFTQGEDDAAFVLINDAHTGEEEEDND